MTEDQPTPATGRQLNHHRELRTTWFLLLLACISVVAAGVRLYGLADASLWRDEIFTIRDTDRSLTEFGTKWIAAYPTRIALQASGVDTSQMTLANSWQWRDMGVTAWNARIASCIFGIIAVPFLAFASRPILGSAGALVLAALLALSPWHIFWSQTARFYTQQFLFYSLGLIGYFLATERRSYLLLTASLLAIALSFLTQQLAVVIAGVLALDWLVARIRGSPIWLGALGWSLVVLGGTGCIGLLGYQLWNRPQDYAFFWLEGLSFPIGVAARSVFRVDPLVATLVGSGAIWLLLHRGRLAVYLLLGATVPIGCVFLLGIILNVAPRYTFVSLYSWMAAASLLLVAMYRISQPTIGRMLALAPLSLILVSMAVGVLVLERSAYGFNRRFEEAYAYVAEHREPGDLVLADEPMAPYYLEDPDVVPIGPSYRKYLKESHPTPQAALERASQDGQSAWVVVSGKRPFQGEFRKLVRGAYLRESFPLRAGNDEQNVLVYVHRPAHRINDGPQAQRVPSDAAMRSSRAAPQ